MFHCRFLALGVLPILAALAACSQTPSPPVVSAAVPPAPNSSQILIKGLIAETDQAGLDKLFPSRGAGTDFPNAADESQGSGARIGLLEGQISDVLRQLATESKISVLGRPYLLTYPDMQAQLKVGQDMTYIASFKPHDPADPATGYDPENKHFFTGINLSCTTHVFRDSVIIMDVDFSTNQLVRMELQLAPGVPAARQLKTMTPIFQTTSAKSRVAVKNDETVILIAGHSFTQPPANGQLPANAKVQILFLTPHRAFLRDGTSVPVPPDVLAPQSPKAS